MTLHVETDFLGQIFSYKAVLSAGQFSLFSLFLTQGTIPYHQDQFLNLQNVLIIFECPE